MMGSCRRCWSCRSGTGVCTGVSGAAGGGKHRLKYLRVAGASAQVSLEPVPDVILGRVWDFPEKSGRVDIVITRPGDQTGASSAGLLAALLIEPVAVGTGSLSVTGSASIPGGASAPLQFSPAGITVR